MKKYIIYVVILSIIEISLTLFLTFWREAFWNFVQHKDYSGFVTELMIFSVVAVFACSVTAYSGYFLSLISIKWRKYLNGKAIKLPEEGISNVNQRIQEDCRDYPDLMLNVGVGLVKAILYVAVFSISLVIKFEVMYLVYIVAYAVLSTILARYIATPLISLNYKAQCAEASYRNDLTFDNFQSCLGIMLGLAGKTKRLSYFQTMYGQIAIILPIVIVAHTYFAGSMTMGGLMMATSTMGVITENMSYGINSFNRINRLISCRVRLKEIGIL